MISTGHSDVMEECGPRLITWYYVNLASQAAIEDFLGSSDSPLIPHARKNTMGISTGSCTSELYLSRRENEESMVLFD